MKPLHSIASTENVAGRAMGLAKIDVSGSGERGECSVDGLEEILKDEQARLLQIHPAEILSMVWSYVRVRVTQQMETKQGE